MAYESSAGGGGGVSLSKDAIYYLPSNAPLYPTGAATPTTNIKSCGNIRINSKIKIHPGIFTLDTSTGKKNCVTITQLVSGSAVDNSSAQLGLNPVGLAIGVDYFKVFRGAVAGSKLEGVTALNPAQVFKAKNSITTYDDLTTRPYHQTNRRYGQGSTVTIYHTWNAANGAVYGATDSGKTTWVLLYTANGNLNQNLERQSENVEWNAPSNPTTNNGATSAPTDYGGGGGTDTTGAGTVNIEMDDDWDQYSVEEILAEMNRMAGKSPTDNLTALNKMQYCIGIPPKITEAADPRYMTALSPSNNFGRTYAELFMMQNTVFSIQPIKVKYLPGFNDDQKAGFISSIAGYVSGGLDDAGILEGGKGEGLSGDLFETLPDYNVYINTVNLLARTMSVYLDIGDMKYQGTGPTYKTMDYSFYREKQPKGGGDGGILGFLADTIRGARAALIDSAINDDTYIHFYTTADGTSMTDSFSVSTKSSGLESLFNNNLSELGSEIQFMLGGTLSNSTIASLGDEVLGMIGGTLNKLGDVGATLSNMVKYGANYLKGGRLVFPQMLDDCTYDRTYSCSCRFLAPNGSRESIFLGCYLPLCYILPFVMPQMLSDNMYRYPMLAKVDVPGMVHAELCAVSNLRIQRGGPDGQSFTADGLPFEVSVSFDITPLYSRLMVTNARHPVLFLSNSALHEYLGSMCGVTFTGNQLALKFNIAKALFQNYVPDIFGSMQRSWWDNGFSKALSKFFNF